MIRIASLCLIFALCIGCNSSKAQQDATVKTGIEVLVENNFELLQGKRVGLITNATGVNANLVSTIDLIDQAEGVELAALYGPEHGVRGEYAAGDKVKTYVDERTGVTVFSLYGDTRKPNAEMLEGIDVLVYDIQDIGVRSYTYISTMGLAMEAAAEHDIDFVVLDRPNPLGGYKIEGNIVEEGYISFVSQFPVPYIYGLTPGEIAKMINDEGWLEGGQKVKLDVVGMEGWSRNMTFDETGLPWVPTSPHIPHEYSAYFYVATGIMGELGVFSEGVGYTLPFQVFAAEWIDEAKLAIEMNALNLPGVIFRPTVFKPFYGKHQGKELHGVQIHFSDIEEAELMNLQFYFMQVHHKLYPDVDLFAQAENRWSMFDKVNGTDQIRKLFGENYLVSDIEAYLNKDVQTFREKSKAYYLYN
ncbi:MAG: DUF1343 domain-containing protein [Balneolaceae bacterium]|nr:DUF1343 domain-containing protein [Balneolaceae bacterium]